MKFFASYREAIGRAALDVEVEKDTNISGLLEQLKQDHPGLGALTENLIVSVNREYASYDTILKDGDEVALLPPVSGG